MGIVDVLTSYGIGALFWFSCKRVKPMRDILAGVPHDRITLFIVEVLLDQNGQIVDLIEDHDPTVIRGVVNLYVVICVVAPDFIRLRQVLMVFVFGVI